MEYQKIEEMIKSAILHERQVEQAMLNKCELPEEESIVRTIYSHARVTLICLQHDIYMKELDHAEE